VTLEVPLILAGSLAVVSAAIHVVGGEALMKRVSPEMRSSLAITASPLVRKER
jgi:hypothetical protein